MTFKELSLIRHSVRGYTSRPVEDEKLQQILEAARVAPTAANKQPQRIYVLRSEESLTKLRSLCRMNYGAPLALMICYDENTSWKSTIATFGEDYEGGEVDAAIVTSAMMMQATELGLGSLWVRGMNAQLIHDEFCLPENEHLVAMLMLGYEDADNPLNQRRRARKPLEDLVQEL